MATLMEKSEQAQYERRLKRHKRQKLFIIIGIVVLIAGGCVYLINAYVNRVFNSYGVVKQIERKDTESTQYYNYKSGILKVSRDGASALDETGNLLFDGSYTMRNPKVDICGDYVAVADIGGYDIYVFDGENSGTKLTVEAPILQVEVAKQGVVAVLMEGKDTNTIHLINSNTTSNSLVADVTTNVYDNGFPVNISLSNDGKKLVTNYLVVKNGVLESKVTFYNFSEVGQNSVNRLIAMKDYGKKVISRVDFLNNDTVGVFAEDGIYLYSMPEKVSDIKEITFDQEIKSVFSNSSYVGVVLEQEAQENQYQVLAYDMGGSKVLDQYIDYTYDQILLADKEILFYSEYNCNILKLNGVEKFSYTFESPVTGLFPINNYNKYMLISDSTIDIIKLTEE